MLTPRQPTIGRDEYTTPHYGGQIFTGYTGTGYQHTPTNTAVVHRSAERERPGLQRGETSTMKLFQTSGDTRNDETIPEDRDYETIPEKR